MTFLNCLKLWSLLFARLPWLTTQEWQQWKSKNRSRLGKHKIFIPGNIIIMLLIVWTVLDQQFSTKTEKLRRFTRERKPSTDRPACMTEQGGLKARVLISTFFIWFFIGKTGDLHHFFFTHRTVFFLFFIDEPRPFTRRKKEGKKKSQKWPQKSKFYHKYSTKSRNSVFQFRSKTIFFLAGWIEPNPDHGSIRRRERGESKLFFIFLLGGGWVKENPHESEIALKRAHRARQKMFCPPPTPVYSCLSISPSRNEASYVSWGGRKKISPSQGFELTTSRWRGFARVNDQYSELKFVVNHLSSIRSTLLVPVDGLIFLSTIIID